MNRTISKSIDELLDGTDLGDTAIKYLDVIRNNLRVCIEAFDRRLNVLFVSVITFELLTHAGVSEASIAGLKLTNLTLIEKLLPIGIAYLYYSLATIIGYRRLLEEVHDAIMRKAQPEFFNKDLEVYGHPPTAFHIERIIELGTEGRFRTTMNVLAAPLKLVIGVGPAFYLVYAVGRGFWRFGAADPLVWIAAIVAGMFIAQVFSLIEGVNRLTRR